MATLAGTRPNLVGDERFFVVGAIAMTAVLVAGFSMQLAAGRSSFAAPWPVHLHAVTFFGWTGLYLVQTLLAGTGQRELHKRLGWLSLIWIPALVAVGLGTVVRIVRSGTVPFFFTPAYFATMDILALMTFAGLAIAAIRLRRRTEWHRRLMFCAMAMLLGPGFGRLLPMPFLIPVAGLMAQLPSLAFPLAGMIADRRRSGSVHPAWLWGFAAMLLTNVVIEAFGNSQIAAAVTRGIATASPGAAIDPLSYPAPPPGLLITGR